MSRNANDDRSDSMNPNNSSYQENLDNHSNQLNSNNDSYWQSRGYNERPDDYETQE